MPHCWSSFAPTTIGDEPGTFDQHNGGFRIEGTAIG